MKLCKMRFSPPINIHVGRRKVDAKGRDAAIRRRGWYQTVVCAMSAWNRILDRVANESVTPTRTKKRTLRLDNVECPG